MKIVKLCFDSSLLSILFSVFILSIKSVFSGFYLFIIYFCSKLDVLLPTVESLLNLDLKLIKIEAEECQEMPKLCLSRMLQPNLNFVQWFLFFPFR